MKIDKVVSEGLENDATMSNERLSVHNLLFNVNNFWNNLNAKRHDTSVWFQIKIVQMMQLIPAWSNN